MEMGGTPRRIVGICYSQLLLCRSRMDSRIHKARHLQRLRWKERHRLPLHLQHLRKQPLEIGIMDARLHDSHPHHRHTGRKGRHREVFQNNDARPLRHLDRTSRLLRDASWGLERIGIYAQARLQQDHRFRMAKRHGTSLLFPQPRTRLPLHLRILFPCGS